MTEPASGVADTDRAREILERRARTLAQPLQEPAPGELVDLVAFGLAGERYAVEPAGVVAVLPLPELTVVPGTPPAILGVASHRGRILPVLDLRPLVGASLERPLEARVLVVLEAAGIAVGVACETLTGLLRVAADEIAPPPAGTGRGRDRLVYGVTPDLLALLDVGALVADPRVEVNDEIDGAGPRQGGTT